MEQIEFIALVLLGFAIYFNFFVFSPNNIGGVISPILSISVLILAGGFAYLAFSWRFTKEGRKGLENYEKARSELWESLTSEEKAIKTYKIKQGAKRFTAGLGIVFLMFVIIGLINIYSQPKSTQDPNRGCYLYIKKRICQ